MAADSTTATFANTATWLLSTPAVLGGIGLWLVGHLGLEALWYRRSRHAEGRTYDWAEATRSLRAFVVVGIAQVLLSGLLMPVLWWVWPYRLQTLDMGSPWPWLLAWTLTDFAYYWIHRMLHATRIGWALHAPHHTIRQLSLLDSLRTSWGEQPVGVIAYGVPLVLLGVPPYIAGGFYLFVALYQFAVHTEMDWTLGPLDALIYTPAAHRSHHATTWQEADRNYGGFFLLFDRVFGTWTPTDRHYRPPEYGVPLPDPNHHQPQSLSAVLFGEMRAVARRLRQTPGVAARLRLLLGRPASDARADADVAGP